MNWRRGFVFLGLLLAIGVLPVVAQVNHRPITDFTSAQIWPPISFYDSAFANRWATVDYAGVLERDVLVPHDHALGTHFDGDVTERTLSSGLTLVSVVLHGSNVFLRSWGDGSYFGYTTGSVWALGYPAAKGEILMTLEFTSPEPINGKLPDMWDLFGGEIPGLQLKSFLLNVRGNGELRAASGWPEGTPGTIRIVQRGLFSTGSAVPGHDAVPVEFIKLFPVGAE